MKKIKHALEAIKSQLKASEPPKSEGLKTNTPDSAKRLPQKNNRLEVSKIEISDTAQSYFEKIERIWTIAFLTLPIDLFLLHTDLSYFAKDLPPVLGSLALLVLLSLGFVIREPFVDSLSTIRSKRDQAISWLERSNVIIIFLVGIIFLIQVLESTFESINLAPIIMTVIFAWGIVSSLIQTGSERKKRETLYRENRSLWLDDSNKLVFYFSLAPILSARLLSLAGFVYQSAGMLRYADSITALILSGILLSILKPEKAQFIVPCSRCASWTSRVLKSYQYCPKCSSEKFVRTESDKDSNSIETINNTKTPISLIGKIKNKLKEFQKKQGK